MEVEKEYRSIWLGNLVSLIVPKVQQIPKLVRLLSKCKGDPREEIGDLFGKMSWGTLRLHVGALRFILKTNPDFIPWDDDIVRKLFEMLRKEEISPRKMERLWYTIKKIGGILGILEGMDVEALESKKWVIQGELTTVLIQPQFRAKVPSLQLVKACEIVAVKGRSLTMMYIASFTRFLIGASARFSDAQHTQPSTMVLLEKTVEFFSWQSKTQRLQDPRRKPMPLICPLHSFTGYKWWVSLAHVVSFMQKAPVFKGVDYMLPKPSEDLASFVPRPCTIQQALTWFRKAMATMVRTQKVAPGMASSDLGSAAASGAETGPGSAEVVLEPRDLADFSWHSPRVFMPEWAFQASITRDRRKYLGRWTQDNTADVYTRDHRSQICAIWDEVTPLSAEIPRDIWAPRDLDHPHYKEQEPATPQKRARMEGVRPPRVSGASDSSLGSWSMVSAPPTLAQAIEVDELGKELEIEDSPLQIPAEDGLAEAEEPREKTAAEQLEEEGFGGPDLSEDTGSLEQLVQWYRENRNGKVPCDIVPPHWGGPFFVQMNVRASGRPALKKLHIYDAALKAVGCGFKPARGATHATSAMEVRADPQKAGMAPCSWCFKKFTWPSGDTDPFEQGDETPGAPMDVAGDSDNPSSSSSSESEESDGPQAGEQRVCPPPLPEEALWE